jgi:UDP-GlcNAc:undecaprenyl-phosphate GlcNAc-1-phosphate transferase
MKNFEFFQIIISSLTSLLTCFYVLKTIILDSHILKIYDIPNENRKIHKDVIPTLGGLAIYFTFFIIFGLFYGKTINKDVYYFFISTTILIATGIKDDLIGIDATKKLIIQILCSTIVVIFSDYRITNFNGLFGITTLTFPLSYLVSIFIIIFITNTINLIDGINGLAGTLSIFAFLASILISYNLNSFMTLNFSVLLIFVILPFLYYNIYKPKIFLGDTGSLFLGFTISIIIINLLNKNFEIQYYKSGVCLIFSIVVIPLMDTIRVFLLRIFIGKSPFSADNNHIHHRLLHLGFTHIQITIILFSLTLLFFLINLFLQYIGDLQLFVFDLFLIVILNILIWTISKKENIINRIKNYNN